MPAVHEIVHAGKQLEVVALDLEQEPNALLAQIDAIAGKIRAMRRLATPWYQFTPSDSGLQKGYLGNGQ